MSDETYCNPYNIAGEGYDGHDFVQVDDRGNITGPADECLRCGWPTPEKAERDAIARQADAQCMRPRESSAPLPAPAPSGTGDVETLLVGHVAKPVVGCECGEKYPEYRIAGFPAWWAAHVASLLTAHDTALREAEGERIAAWMSSHEASKEVTDALYHRGVFVLRAKVREVLTAAAAIARGGA